MHLTWYDPQQLAEIAQAVVKVLGSAGDFFPQLGMREAKIELIDPAVPHPLGPGLRERLDLPLRLLLAVVAGVGLAFLLDYLDDTVRSREELEGMGLEVLAEIPPRRRRPWERR